MIVELPGLAAVAALGERIARRIKPGDVIALSGTLGAGKTTLARAIISALGYTGEVPSPTFTIIETYLPPAVRMPLVHADFYRLERPAEADELGLDDYREGAALIAEWPEHVGGFMTEPGCLSIALEIGGSGRRAIVEPGADWQSRPL
jgi:tRNA threonylcarbamoyladenosine biosynthesis protein TsaE